MIDIMIADDNLVFAKQLSDKLTQEKDFRVVSIVEDGFQALVDYESLQPDVLFLDLKMPNIDGYQVIDILSKTPNEKNKQNIIVATADGTAMASLHNTRKVVWLLYKCQYNEQLLFQIIREIKSESQSTDIKKEIDKLFKDLKFDSALKGTLLLKRSIYLSYTNPLKYSKADDLIKVVAKEFKYNSDISARSTMDKALSQMLNTHKNLQFLYEIFDDFYGYNLSVKYLIRYSVNYLRKKIR